MDEILEQNGVDETLEVKSPKIGQFTPKDKFIEFIGGKGNVNFFTNEALVKGRHLSGSLNQEMTFKLTICDEGTVDFEEVDTQFTTKEERQRLLDLISDKSLSPSRIKNHFIVSELPFTAVRKINDRDITVYLAVDYVTPISKLASFFEDEEVSMNQEQDSKLNQLLSMFDDDPIIEEKVEDVVEDNNVEVEEVKSESTKRLEESFKQMKEDKIEELKRRIEHQRKELFRFNHDKKNLEKKAIDAEEDIKLLESRLDTLVPDADPNGFVFFVSEELNQKTELPEDIEKLIREKISKVKSINVEGFMKLFDGGEYQVRLGKIENDILSEVTDYDTLPQEIKDSLDFLQLQEATTDKGEDYTILDHKLVHLGQMKWHDIVRKMIRLGFGQSPEFDKMCGSSSFGSGEGTNTYQPRVNIEEAKKSMCSDQNGNLISTIDVDDYDDGEDDGDDGTQGRENIDAIDESYFEGGDYDDPDEEFIFGIYSNPLEDPSISISISPKSYFIQYGYAYDDHLEQKLRSRYPMLKALGSQFEEVMEGCFFINNGKNWNSPAFGYLNLDQIVDILCKAGVSPSLDYQTFLSNSSGMISNIQDLVNSVTSQGYKMV